MVTEMITMKMENNFLKEVDDIVKTQGFQNRTEFIRNALRDKIEEIKLKKAMMKLADFKGISKKSNDEQYEKIRSEAFEKISKKLI